MLPLIIGSILVVGVAVLAVVMVLRRPATDADSVGGSSEPSVDTGGGVDSSMLQRFEAELRIKEEWYRVLFNNTTDMVLVHGVTADGLPSQFVDVNDVACERLGYSREKLLSMTPFDIESVSTPSMVSGYSRSELVILSDDYIAERSDRESTQESRRLMRELIEKTQVFYSRTYVARDGVEIPVEINAHRFALQDSSMVLNTVHDISERKAAEHALYESEQRFRDFFAHSPLGVAMYDPERQLVNVNKSCLRMFGAPDRFEFANFNMFDNSFIPRSVKGRIDKGETVRFDASIDFDEIRDKGMFVSRRQGMGYLDILITNLGVDRDYKPRGYLSQVQDVTSRRETEDALTQSEHQLQQSKKMEALGTLAGGIAHDFNNILTPILGYAEITMRLASDNEMLCDYMQEIIKGSHRAKDLIDQILTFSRRSDAEGERMRIRITPIVKEALKLLEASTPDGIKIRRVIKTERDCVLADPTQFHQVIMNLCTNAVYVMRDTGGVLEVRLMDFVLMNSARSEFPDLAPGRYLRLSVSDTGCGMDRATAERIFEPFFTTKKRGEGTGMGLSVVHGVITGMKGTITLDTELGKGTTFHVILPLVAEAAEEAEVTGAAIEGGSGRILLVDDEIDIIKMGSHMLAALGYEAVVASESPEALRIFKEDPDKFDLVITDQLMPEMSGAELARNLLDIRPELPIICCTGFSEAFSPEQAERLGIREFLKKPMEMATLAEAITRALEG